MRSLRHVVSLAKGRQGFGRASDSEGIMVSPTRRKHRREFLKNMLLTLLSWASPLLAWILGVG
jgi:hypothetical protein